MHGAAHVSVSLRCSCRRRDRLGGGDRHQQCAHPLGTCKYRRRGQDRRRGGLWQYCQAGRTHPNPLGQRWLSVPLELNGNTLIIDSGGGNAMKPAVLSPATACCDSDGGSNPIRIKGSTGNTYTGSPSWPTAGCHSKRLPATPCGPHHGERRDQPGVGHARPDQRRLERDPRHGRHAESGRLHRHNQRSLSGDGYLCANRRGRRAQGGQTLLNGIQQPEVAKMAGDGFVRNGLHRSGRLRPAGDCGSARHTGNPTPTDGSTTVHPAVLTKLDWAD